MMSEAPQYARYAIIEHVVHLVNRDYEAMCRDYYTLEVSCLHTILHWPCIPCPTSVFPAVLERISLTLHTNNFPYIF